MNIRLFPVLSAAVIWATAQVVIAAEPVDIGSRRELFVDDFVIDELSGDAVLHLHKPEAREVMLVTDEPWEGNTCAYFTVFQDDDRYRMYYRGSHYDTAQRKMAHRQVTCYAESDDGVRWTKPQLGLFDFDGSRENNIVWDGVGTHNFVPFKDPNPACSDDAKYKAFAGGGHGYSKGLYPLKSPDGIHWTLMSETPVITEGAFDSQNLAFWDPVHRLYRDYHRTFRNGVRDIMTCTSADFLNWTDPVHLDYGDAPREHLYTNTVRPYERAPHILIAFPTRFLPATQQVEPTFMSSRDGRRFHRWTEALIPLTAPADRAGNRSNYMAWGLVQLPGNDREYSVYATEAYYTGPDSRLRRFVYRVDGFVSARAPEQGGELLTKPLKFAGRELAINYAAGAGGRVRVELQSADGTPLANYQLSDCTPLEGDAIDQVVTWKDNADVGQLAGRPVRLRFQLKDADLFSFQFRD